MTNPSPQLLFPELPGSCPKAAGHGSPLGDSGTQEGDSGSRRCPVPPHRALQGPQGTHPGEAPRSALHGASRPCRRPWDTKCWSPSSSPALATRSHHCSDWSPGTGHLSRPVRVRSRLLLEPTERDCPRRGCHGSPAPTTPRLAPAIGPRCGAQPTLPRENSSLCCGSGQLLITSGSSISSQSTRSPEQGPSCTASRLKGERGGLRNGQPGLLTDWPRPCQLTCSCQPPAPLGPGAPSPAAAGSSPPRRAARSGTWGQWQRVQPAAPPGAVTPPQSDPGGLRRNRKCSVCLQLGDRQAPDHLTPGQKAPGALKANNAPASPVQGSQR